MFTKFHHMLAARRRRRALVKIRQEFARYGYPLDGLADADIEASLPPGMCDTPPGYLGAKTISRALRRLSPSVTGGHGHAREEVRKVSVTEGEVIRHCERCDSESKFLIYVLSPNDVPDYARMLTTEYHRSQEETA